MIYSKDTIGVILNTIWHKTLAVENFGGLLPINFLADKTLVDWLPYTEK